MFSFYSLPPSCPERGRVLPTDDIGDPDQRLALYIIKSKCNFVPEHMEQRTLYNPVTPHIPQVLRVTVRGRGWGLYIGA